MAAATPFVTLDAVYATAVVDCADIAESKDDLIRRIGKDSLDLMHRAAHAATKVFAVDGLPPKLTDWESTGGAYFVRDPTGKSGYLAVIKPEDEEPYAINNPKRSGLAADAAEDALPSLAAEAATPPVLPPATAVPVPPLPPPRGKRAKHRGGTRSGPASPLQLPPPPPAPSRQQAPAAPVVDYIKKGILPGEGAAREAAAYLLDHNHNAGVPPTCLVLTRHEAYHVSRRYRRMVAAQHSSAAVAAARISPALPSSAAAADRGALLPAGAAVRASAMSPLEHVGQFLSSPLLEAVSPLPSPSPPHRQQLLLQQRGLGALPAGGGGPPGTGAVLQSAVDAALDTSLGGSSGRASPASLESSAASVGGGASGEAGGCFRRPEAQQQQQPGFAAAAPLAGGKKSQQQWVQSVMASPSFAPVPPRVALLAGAAEAATSAVLAAAAESEVASGRTTPQQHPPDHHTDGPFSLGPPATASARAAAGSPLAAPASSPPQLRAQSQPLAPPASSSQYPGGASGLPPPHTPSWWLLLPEVPIKRASLQLFVPHDCTAEALSSSLWPVEQVHRLAVLDIRLCNTDRNDDNILVRALFDGDPALEDARAAEEAEAARRTGGGRLQTLEGDADDDGAGSDDGRFEVARRTGSGGALCDSPASGEGPEALGTTPRSAAATAAGRHKKARRLAQRAGLKGASSGSSPRSPKKSPGAQARPPAPPPPPPVSSVLLHWDKRLREAVPDAVVAECAASANGCCIIESVLVGDIVAAAEKSGQIPLSVRGSGGSGKGLSGWPSPTVSPLLQPAASPPSFNERKPLLLSMYAAASAPGSSSAPSEAALLAASQSAVTRSSTPPLPLAPSLAALPPLPPPQHQHHGAGSAGQSATHQSQRYPSSAAATSSGAGPSSSALAQFTSLVRAHVAGGSGGNLSSKALASAAGSGLRASLPHSSVADFMSFPALRGLPLAENDGAGGEDEDDDGAGGSVLSSLSDAQILLLGSTPPFLPAGVAGGSGGAHSRGAPSGRPPSSLSLVSAVYSPPLVPIPATTIAAASSSSSIGLCLQPDVGGVSSAGSSTLQNPPTTACRSRKDGSSPTPSCDTLAVGRSASEGSSVSQRKPVLELSPGCVDDSAGSASASASASATPRQHRSPQSEPLSTLPLAAPLDDPALDWSLADARVPPAPPPLHPDPRAHLPSATAAHSTSGSAPGDLTAALAVMRTRRNTSSSCGSAGGAAGAHALTVLARSPSLGGLPGGASLVVCMVPFQDAQKQQQQEEEKEKRFEKDASQTAAPSGAQPGPSAIPASPALRVDCSAPDPTGCPASEEWVFAPQPRDFPDTARLSPPPSAASAPAPAVLGSANPPLRLAAATKVIAATPHQSIRQSTFDSITSGPQSLRQASFDSFTPAGSTRQASFEGGRGSAGGFVSAGNLSLSLSVSRTASFPRSGTSDSVLSGDGSSPVGTALLSASLVGSTGSTPLPPVRRVGGVLDVIRARTGTQPVSPVSSSGHGVPGTVAVPRPASTGSLHPSESSDSLGKGAAVAVAGEGTTTGSAGGTQLDGQLGATSTVGTPGSPAPHVSSTHRSGGVLQPHVGATSVDLCVAHAEVAAVPQALPPAAPTAPATAAAPFEAAVVPPVPGAVATPASTAAAAPADSAAKPKPQPWRSSRLSAMKAAADGGSSSAGLPSLAAGQTPPPINLDVDLSGVAVAASGAVARRSSGDANHAAAGARSYAAAVSVDSGHPHSAATASVPPPPLAPPPASPPPVMDAKRLKAAARIELIPIDHGLCLPSINALEDVSLNWVHWKQARAPPSAETLAYVASLDGRADALMLRAVLGDRIRPPCLLTLRVCTALLQAGLAAGLTLAEVGLMMARGSGVGVLAPNVSSDRPPLPVGATPRGSGGGGSARSGGGGSVGAAFDPYDPDSPSALEQAVRKARRLAVRGRRQAIRGGGAAPASSSSSVGAGVAAGAAAFWHSPTLGPRRDDSAAAAAAAAAAAGTAASVTRSSPGRTKADEQQHQQQPWNRVSRASRARKQQLKKAALRDAHGGKQQLQHAADASVDANGGGVGDIAGGGRVRGVSVCSAASGGTAASASLALVPASAGAPDTGTLAFLPYHDAVVAHFRAAIGEHIQAALRGRAGGS